MYERYVKIRPEHKFSVPLGNHERFGYKTFDTIGEAVFFAACLLGKEYKFVALKDHPYEHRFSAMFEYTDENGEKKLRSKAIRIPNYAEVERKYNPVGKYRLASESWDSMRALFGTGPYAKPQSKWVYMVD